MVAFGQRCKAFAGGVSELTDLLKQIHDDGVSSIPAGAQTLDGLLTETEEWRGKLVVVFAGDKKPMEDLFGHHEGLPSRFSTTLDFVNFSCKALL